MFKRLNRGDGRTENTTFDIAKLESEFKSCQKLLNAIGDETRQRLICIMLEGSCSGDRAVDIAERTNLSRPAVSHHLQILKDAGFVKSRKEGTCIYYYLAPDEGEMQKLGDLVEDIQCIMDNAPDRSGES